MSRRHGHLLIVALVVLATTRCESDDTAPEKAADDGGRDCPTNSCDASEDCASGMICHWQQDESCLSYIYPPDALCNCVRECRSRCVESHELGCIDDASCCKGICEDGGTNHDGGRCVAECRSDTECLDYEECIDARCEGEPGDQDTGTIQTTDAGASTSTSTGTESS